MEIYDVIEKKRDGGELNEAEIKEMLSPNVSDHQLSALLMAICIRGMTQQETLILTREMVNMGYTFDFSDDPTVVDLHSTGGVGDKCTLVVVPIVTACGVKVAKMAGRGLGYTGGTIDKLMSFEGFNSALTPQKFERNVRERGVAIIEQTDYIAPADKRLYEIRDVTATVRSAPLIAASIMSKKLATGAPNIVLNVTFGSGAFMKTREEAEQLAQMMMYIGNNSGRLMDFVLTDMNAPLGLAVGNNLEVKEAIDALKGEKIMDLMITCIDLSARMIRMGLGVSYGEGIRMADNAIKSGAALAKFQELVELQGGRWTETFPRAPVREVLRDVRMDAGEIGEMVCKLGAGRMKKGDEIDLSVGVKIRDKSTGVIEVCQRN
ncbi:MAG: thymidine phosphorylase [Clostridiales bacterium]|jgi:pyrimidine-nucleoside phosphorylase|nr:thymidine phosphorylase [Clostridiales bacterium]